MGGGSPSSTTTTVDKKYNAGMLKLSQEQQGWAREMFNMFKYGVTYDPNEEVMETQTRRIPQYINQPAQYDKEGQLISAGGLRLAGYKTVTEEVGTGQTRGEVEGYDPDAQISEMEYLQNLVESNASLLGLETDVRKTGLEAQKERIGFYNDYMGEIKKGIDVKGRMDEAQAEVQHGFKNARRTTAKELGAYGLDPASGRFSGMRRDLELSEAAGISGARTQAKRIAEDEDFRRKTVGLQIPPG